MRQKSVSIPQPKKRNFLPKDFTVKQWASIEPFYAQLLSRVLASLPDLRQWIEDKDELESVIQEDTGWRYINAKLDTTNKAYQKNYQTYLQEILPKTIPITHQLNEKVLLCPFLQDLHKEIGFGILVKIIKSDQKIYRKANIPILTQIQLETQEYYAITGAMQIEIDGKTCTLEQAAVYLEWQDRNVRKQTYEKIGQRRLQDKDKLDTLYTSLIKQRHQMALNADFDNFRDYMFLVLKRFDYTPKDCLVFHESVIQEAVPLLHTLANYKKDGLSLSQLNPWDKHVDPSGKPALRPFKNAEELLKKIISVFSQLDPFLGDCLRTMQAMKHLDLTARKGKAPGGFNYPLDEIGVPFIFMNATSTFRDMITLLHEGGHAVHNFLTRDLPINRFKHPPSEVAELASMTMELITMDYWSVFFDNEEDLKRAKRQHIAQIIETLPWVALIDKFQHWVYGNPYHTVTQRKTMWVQIFDEFSDNITDWSGQEIVKNFLWQKQLHLYEVPFYYIEYAIAQLGAIAIWQQYKQNPTQALKNYLNALKLGYTQSVPDIYKTAGIDFNFSRPYIKNLMTFLKQEWEKLQ